MPDLILPDWPAPPGVKAVTTTRSGGFSRGCYDSFNLATHVGDDPSAVEQNRALLRQQLALPAEPAWLQQVHSDRVVAASDTAGVEADASWSDRHDRVCVVMTADCLPLLFCNQQGDRVAACHAGWRGLHAGIIQSTLACFDDPEDIMVWLGPAIGPDSFEVGEDVFTAFVEQHADNAQAFTRRDEQHWLCDIYALARGVLARQGVKQVYGGGLCTLQDAHRFYSYRRDSDTGRLASLIWLIKSGG